MMVMMAGEIDNLGLLGGLYIMNTKGFYEIN